MYNTTLRMYFCNTAFIQNNNFTKIGNFAQKIVAQ